VFTEAGNGRDHLLHPRRGDQSRALKMSGRVLVPRAPGETLWSKRCRGSFQHQLQARQLITRYRYGVENPLVG